MLRVCRRLERRLAGEPPKDDEIDGVGGEVGGVQQLPRVRVRHAAQDAPQVGKGRSLDSIVESSTGKGHQSYEIMGIQKAVISH